MWTGSDVARERTAMLPPRAGIIRPGDLARIGALITQRAWRGIVYAWTVHSWKRAEFLPHLLSFTKEGKNRAFQPQELGPGAYLPTASFTSALAWAAFLSISAFISSAPAFTSAAAFFVSIFALSMVFSIHSINLRNIFYRVF
jgi:hypothetical protein